jgi:hypothetical protein
VTNTTRYFYDIRNTHGTPVSYRPSARGPGCRMWQIGGGLFQAGILGMLAWVASNAELALYVKTCSWQFAPKYLEGWLPVLETFPHHSCYSYWEFEIAPVHVKWRSYGSLILPLNGRFSFSLLPRLVRPSEICKNVISLNLRLERRA